MKKLSVVIVLGVCLVALFALTAAPAMACTDYGWYSPGYWAHHDWWTPVTVGGITYDQNAGQPLMLTPSHGDKTYAMFNALVAAELNDQGTTYTWIWEADQWLRANPLGSGVTGDSDAWSGPGSGSWGSGRGEVIFNALQATFVW